MQRLHITRQRPQRGIMVGLQMIAYQRDFVLCCRLFLNKFASVVQMKPAAGNAFHKHYCTVGVSSGALRPAQLVIALLNNYIIRSIFPTEVPHENPAPTRRGLAAVRNFQFIISMHAIELLRKTPHQRMIFIKIKGITLVLKFMYHTIFGNEFHHKI